MAAYASTPLTFNSGGSLSSVPNHVTPLVPDQYPAMVSRNVQRPLLHRPGTKLVLVLYGYGSGVSSPVQRICYREIVGTLWYVDSNDILFCGIDHLAYHSLGMVRIVHNKFFCISIEAASFFNL